MHTLNIGILAHVDAGKTSLTERLLFDHGAVLPLSAVEGVQAQTRVLMRTCAGYGCPRSSSSTRSTERAPAPRTWSPTSAAA